MPFWLFICSFTRTLVSENKIHTDPTISLSIAAWPFFKIFYNFEAFSDLHFITVG